MIIQSIQGSILYQSRKITFKTALEEAVAAGADLSHGDFRGQKLYQAKLDGIMAPGASFWGCDCRGADMAGGNLRDADLRGVDLKDACLAQSNLSSVNFSGAYFNSVILRQCNMENAIFSCPSLFSCVLSETHSLKHAIYCHRGEIDLPLDPTPIVINGLSRRMVLFGHAILWGDAVLPFGKVSNDAEVDFKHLKSTIDRFS